MYVDLYIYFFQGHFIRFGGGNCVTTPMSSILSKTAVTTNDSFEKKISWCNTLRQHWHVISYLCAFGYPLQIKVCALVKYTGQTQEKMPVYLPKIEKDTQPILSHSLS